MLNCFNKHFISSSSSQNTISPVIESEPSTDVSEFSFQPFTLCQVHKALKLLDARKPQGPDLIDPYLLKIAADFIVQPLTHIFNLSMSSMQIPKIWKSAFVTPLFKGGDPTILNNYRPISKLCILSKMFESLINNQLKDFLNSNNILCNFQSGFRKGHSTTTATLKVINDISTALDNKQHCAALFVDLSKAFDSVNHILLKKRLINIGLSKNAVGLIFNYLSDRSQCTKSDGMCSKILPLAKGVPQGSVLGPLLFTIYVNNVGQELIDTKYHFYADDMVIYSFAKTLNDSVSILQNAFNIIQKRFINLDLSLNAKKSKFMSFSNKRSNQLLCTPIVSLQGAEIERVKSFKYLGIIIDENLNFKGHVEQLIRKLRLKIGFYFRNRLCFSFNAKKKLVAATFLPILDYGDLIYINAPTQVLKQLDSVYHASLRFITNCKPRTHHCELYTRVGWPPLDARRLTHWCMFIYKAILRLLPLYLCEYIELKAPGMYSLRSQQSLLLSVPSVRTEVGKAAFRFSAPTTWNNLQKDLNLKDLVPISQFKLLLKGLEMKSTICKCF